MSHKHEQFSIPGLEANDIENIPLREDVAANTPEHTVNPNAVDITPITERMKEGDISFDEAVKAVGALYEDEWEKRIDRHQESAYADLGYVDTNRPQQPSVSKRQFLDMVQHARGRDELFWELHDPNTHRQRLARLETKLELFEQRVLDIELAEALDDIRSYTGLESVDSFKSLIRIKNRFDTQRPVLPEPIQS